MIDYKGLGEKISHLYDITGMEIKSLQSVTESSEMVWLAVINPFSSSVFLLQQENVLNAYPGWSQRKEECHIL